jgi:hypothetical protein
MVGIVGISLERTVRRRESATAINWRSKTDASVSHAPVTLSEFTKLRKIGTMLRFGRVGEKSLDGKLLTKNVTRMTKSSPVREVA